MTTLTTSNGTECETIGALKDNNESRTIGRRLDRLDVCESGSDLLDVVFRGDVCQVAVDNPPKNLEKTKIF